MFSLPASASLCVIGAPTCIKLLISASIGPAGPIAVLALGKIFKKYSSVINVAGVRDCGEDFRVAFFSKKKFVQGFYKLVWMSGALCFRLEKVKTINEELV